MSRTLVRAAYRPLRRQQSTAEAALGFFPASRSSCSWKVEEERVKDQHVLPPHSTQRRVLPRFLLEDETEN